eukprot:scaffold47675_cov63-Phaeocystis_antarctica.AAC.3
MLQMRLRLLHSCSRLSKARLLLLALLHRARLRLCALPHLALPHPCQVHLGPRVGRRVGRLLLGLSRGDGFRIGLVQARGRRLEPSLGHGRRHLASRLLGTEMLPRTQQPLLPQRLSRRA